MRFWFCQTPLVLILTTGIKSYRRLIVTILAANQCKLYAPMSGPGKDLPSVITELKKYAEARKIPKGKLIMGTMIWSCQKADCSNRDDLDKAFPDNPAHFEQVSSQVLPLCAPVAAL